MCREKQLLFKHRSCFSDDGCDFIFEILDKGGKVDGVLVVVFVGRGIMDIRVHIAGRRVGVGSKGCNGGLELVHSIGNEGPESIDFRLEREEIRGVLFVGFDCRLRIAVTGRGSLYCFGRGRGIC